MTGQCKRPEPGPPRNDAKAGATSPAKPVLRVDIDKYQHHFEDTDLTEPQKRDVIEALWSIVVSFVELGFDVQQVQHACGKVPESASLGPIPAPDEVQLDITKATRKFEDANGDRRLPARERQRPC